MPAPPTSREHYPHSFFQVFHLDRTEFAGRLHMQNANAVVKLATRDSAPFVGLCQHQILIQILFDLPENTSANMHTTMDRRCGRVIHSFSDVASLSTSIAVLLLFWPIVLPISCFWLLNGVTSTKGMRFSENLLALASVLYWALIYVVSPLLGAPLLLLLAIVSFAGRAALLLSVMPVPRFFSPATSKLTELALRYTSSAHNGLVRMHDVFGNHPEAIYIACFALSWAGLWAAFLSILFLSVPVYYIDSVMRTLALSVYDLIIWETVVDWSVILFWPVINSRVSDSIGGRVLQFQDHVRHWKSKIYGMCTVLMLSSHAHGRGAVYLSLILLGPIFPLSIVSFLSYILVTSMPLGLAIRLVEKPAHDVNQRVKSGIYTKPRLLLENSQTSINRSPSYESAMIRLLTILPRRSDHVECRMDVVDISASYEALSYVWGAIERQKYSITLNGVPFWVSRSLHQVILRLRRRDGPRVVWIDALCIDQSNLSERGSQVLLMRQIYSSATRVIVWLGDHEPWGLGKVCTTSQAREYRSDTSRTEELHYGTARVIARLLSRDWWTRIWIVQEVIVARQVTIQCGRQTLDWDDFCILADRASKKPFMSKRQIHIEEFHSLMIHRNDMKTQSKIPPSSRTIRSRRDSGLAQQAINILQLVYDFRARKATSPHDKIFALLGLAEMPSDPRGSSASFLTPDYRMQPSDLSLHFARTHVRRSRSLCVVALAECARRARKLSPTLSGNSCDKVPDLPSWCPFFADNPSVEAGLLWRPFWTGLSGLVALAGGCAAADCMPIPARSSPHVHVPSPSPMRTERTHLQVYTLPHIRSVVIMCGPPAGSSLQEVLNDAQDVMNFKSTTFLPAYQRWMSWEEVLPLWRHLMEADESRIRRSRGIEAGLSLEERFQLTITAGAFSAQPSSTVSTIESHAFGSPSPSSAQEHRAIRTRNRKPAQKSPTIETSDTYARVRQAACFNRRFFVTAQGHFGLGPADLQVGDEIHVLIGSQVPMALRPLRHSKAAKKQQADNRKGTEAESMGLGIGEDSNLGQKYEYVGQCYIYELMEYDGHLEDELARGDVKLEEAWLC